MKLIPIKNEYYDCYMASLATIAKSYNYDYFMNFYDYIYFDYIENLQNTVTQNIITINPHHAANVLYEFHGIKVKQLEFANIDEAIKNIVSLIKINTPIMIASDIYHCPWSVSYKKIHYPHTFILYEYNNHEFYALDPYFTNSTLTINKNDLHLSRNMAIILIFEQPPKPSLKKEYETLLYGVSNYRNNICIKEKAEMFIKSIISRNFEKELEENFDVNYTLLLRKIRTLESNRLAYLEMIKSLKEKRIIDFENIENDLLNLSKTWLSFRLLIAKYSLKRSLRNKEDQIRQVIIDLFDEEEKIINDLSMLYENFLSKPKSVYF